MIPSIFSSSCPTRVDGPRLLRGLISGRVHGALILEHLWQGVAPGSDGQTQRIFERAQDWHARGRYFWTSGVARERSPDAGVESGIVTASRASGGVRSAAQGQRKGVGGRMLVLVLGLGCCLIWRLVFLLSSPFRSPGYCVPWPWGNGHRDCCAVCVPGRQTDRQNLELLVVECARSRFPSCV
ncbi:hypothetical protein F5883DRAFT_544032 [Diaporthe sp. PMI_573]|nr:hypothetical protein F5883DRAFT_544032 [Diaporthaceae sp. PMI_573]